MFSAFKLFHHFPTLAVQARTGDRRHDVGYAGALCVGKFVSTWPKCCGQSRIDPRADDGLTQAKSLQSQCWQRSQGWCMGQPNPGTWVKSGSAPTAYPPLLHPFGLPRSYMDFLGLFEKYWPFMALVLWFAYKWWNSKRVIAMLPELKKNGAIFVDVRSAGEFANGNAPGTINIPLQELGSRLGEIPKSSPVVLCCASGTRSGMAKLMLRKKGYRKVYNIGTWSKFLD